MSEHREPAFYSLNDGRVSNRRSKVESKMITGISFNENIHDHKNEKERNKTIPPTSAINSVVTKLRSLATFGSKKETPVVESLKVFSEVINSDNYKLSNPKYLETTIKVIQFGEPYNSYKENNKHESEQHSKKIMVGNGCIFDHDAWEGCKVKKITTGNSHSLVLFENGNLWSFGSNSFGQLIPGIDSDDANKTPKIDHISSVKNRVFVQTKDPTVPGSTCNLSNFE